MSFARSLGILVALGVPAIIGPGVVWAATESWPAIYVFLALLGLFGIGFIDTRRL